jgi:hypothetical protein
MAVRNWQSQKSTCAPGLKLWGYMQWAQSTGARESGGILRRPHVRSNHPRRKPGRLAWDPGTCGPVPVPLPALAACQRVPLIRDISTLRSRISKYESVRRQDSCICDDLIIDARRGAGEEVRFRGHKRALLGNLPNISQSHVSSPWKSVPNGSMRGVLRFEEPSHPHGCMHEMQSQDTRHTMHSHALVAQA